MCRSDSTRCLACNRLTGSDRRRGLCRVCYRDPEVRDDYPVTPRSCVPPGATSVSPWTPLECVQLLRLFRCGLSDRVIARTMNRSEGSVTKRRQRMGLAVSLARQVTNRQRSKRDV
jgi:hypothetical protein